MSKDRIGLSSTAAISQRVPDHNTNSNMRNGQIAWLCFVGLTIVGICACVNAAYSQSNNSGTNQGGPGEPYPKMPSIAPIGVRIGK